MSRTRIDPSLLNNLSSNLNMGSNKIVSLANGTASTDAMAFGQNHIIQWVSAQDTTSTSTTSSTFQSTNLTATITPTSSSNKILITIAGNLYDGGQAGIAWSVFRGATNIGNSTYGFGRSQVVGGSTALWSTSYTFLDSPATTSATTYTVKIKSVNGSTGVIWNLDTVPTQIFLQEVA